MDGFSQVLLADYSEHLDDRGRHYLERIRAGAQRMGDLIEGLLTLSRVTRKDLQRVEIPLHDVAARVHRRLQESEPERQVDVAIQSPIVAFGDLQLLESVLENLLGNAWKFSAEESAARISVGVDESGATPVYFVQDNGAGFNMEYASKLFAPFQRLHSEREFPGTGIGLATVQRIIHRHGGQIWAESHPGNGATFSFTLSSEERGVRG